MMAMFTLAGTGEKDQRDGEGTVAEFIMPHGLAVDGDGNIIVADSRNHRIHKIRPQGHVSTLAGTGEKGHRNEGTVCLVFLSAYGIAMDGDGNTIVADRHK